MKAFLITLYIFLQSLSFARVEFPTSEDPVKFGQEIEDFIVVHAEQGIPIDGPENRKQEAAIAQDPKDWETTLARIIGNPDKYGSSASRTALGVAARLRKTAGRPEIVDASKVLFFHEVRSSLDKIQEIKSKGGEPGYMDAIHVHGFVHRMLDVGSDQILQMVIEYANSESEDEIGILYEDAPGAIASALRQYGSAIHLEESRKLVNKLHEIGRGDFADDIRRTLNRIERDHGNEGTRKDIRKNGGSAAGSDGKAVLEAKPWGGIPSVWVAVLIGTLVILAGGVGWILLRSKADRR